MRHSPPRSGVAPTPSLGVTAQSLRQPPTLRTPRLSIATSTRYRRRTGSRALAAAAAASPLHRAVGSASSRSSPAMPARENGTRQSSGRHRSTLSLQKTEITIHVYDLLPVSVTPADLLVALFGSLIPHTHSPAGYPRSSGPSGRRCCIPASSSTAASTPTAATTSAASPASTGPSPRRSLPEAPFAARYSTGSRSLAKKRSMPHFATPRTNFSAPRTTSLLETAITSPHISARSSRVRLAPDGSTALPASALLCPAWSRANG